jgi:hypothetical protein
LILGIKKFDGHRKKHHSVVDLCIRTDPAGADVFLQPYESTAESWKKIGTTPIQNVRVAKGYYRYKISKDGSRTILTTVPRGFLAKKISTLLFAQRNG